ncbi:MAG TPA: hypothetical protein VJJ83_02650 [Candidatus Babeliales bacterium]|nr:hypothetical protein [Candidatus Babeliales bacterium]
MKKLLLVIITIFGASNLLAKHFQHLGGERCYVGEYDDCASRFGDGAYCRSYSTGAAESCEYGLIGKCVQDVCSCDHCGHDHECHHRCLNGCGR